MSANGDKTIREENLNSDQILGSASRVISHLTVAERVDRGKAARKLCPRSAHGIWNPAPDRPDPVALLEAQEKGRIPELLPIRYERMLTSEFAFYRGAAVIMAPDFSSST